MVAHDSFVVFDELVKFGVEFIGSFFVAISDCFIDLIVSEMLFDALSDVCIS